MLDTILIIAILCLPFAAPILYRKIRDRFFPPKYDPVSQEFHKQKEGASPYANSVIGSAANPNDFTGPGQ
jgi:hypothetical protein